MAIWDHFFGHTSLVRKFDYNIINDFLKPGKGPVLDIGCGNGHYLGKSFPKSQRIFGVDIKLENLLNARENKALERIHFVCGNAESLPIRENIFTRAYSNSCIEHFSNDKNFFTGINRVLPTGGSLVLTTDSNPGNAAILTKLIYSLAPGFLRDREVNKMTGKGIALDEALVERHKKTHSVVTYYSSQELKERLMEKGFTVTESRYYFNGPLGRFFCEISYCTKFRVIGNGLLGRVFFPLWYFVSLAEHYIVSPGKKGYFLAVRAIKTGDGEK